MTRDVFMKPSKRSKDAAVVAAIGQRVERLKMAVLSEEHGVSGHEMWTRVIMMQPKNPAANPIMCAATSILFNETFLKALLPSEECLSEPAFWAPLSELAQYCGDMDAFQPPSVRWAVFQKLLSEDCITMLMKTAIMS